MSLTNYGRDLKSNLWLGTTTLPTTLYLALLNALPALTVTGISLRDLEPVYEPSYTRKALVMNTTNWNVAAAGSGYISNKYDLTFATPTTSWGSISHYALADDVAEGNVVMFGVLASPVLPVVNQPLVIPAGQLKIREL